MAATYYIESHFTLTHLFTGTTLCGGYGFDKAGTGFCGNGLHTDTFATYGLSMLHADGTFYNAELETGEEVTNAVQSIGLFITTGTWAYVRGVLTLDGASFSTQLPDNNTVGTANGDHILRLECTNGSISASLDGLYYNGSTVAVAKHSAYITTAARRRAANGFSTLGAQSGPPGHPLPIVENSLITVPAAGFWQDFKFAAETDS